MNKCFRCSYYSEYNDNKFAPLPVCTLYSDLKRASEAIKNSDNCKLKKECVKVIERFPISFEEITNIIKTVCDTTQKLANGMKLLADEIVKEVHNE